MAAAKTASQVSPFAAMTLGAQDIKWLTLHSQLAPYMTAVSAKEPAPMPSRQEPTPATVKQNPFQADAKREAFKVPAKPQPPRNTSKPSSSPATPKAPPSSSAPNPSAFPISTPGTAPAPNHAPVFQVPGQPIQHGQYDAVLDRMKKAHEQALHWQETAPAAKEAVPNEKSHGADDAP